MLDVYASVLTRERFLSFVSFFFDDNGDDDDDDDGI